MAGEVKLHVTDIARGLPAVGMKVEVYALLPERQRMLSDFLDGDGWLDMNATEFPRGPYEIVLYVGAFYDSEGIETSDPPFLDDVPIRFRFVDANRECHLRVQITPWGFSVFRER